MREVDYKISNGHDKIRRENRKDFVENSQGTKQNSTAILSIHFNNTDNTKKLLQYLEREKDQSFDIILIENSTKKEEVKTLQGYCQKKDNITIIYPIQNIGSAGGYALGMEYIIDKNYDYFFVVEDDILFLEANVFSDMMQHTNQKTLTFIRNCKNTRSSSQTTHKGKSRRVQVAGYPIEFIKKIGIIDPRYFFRGEDLEWGSRIEQGIKKYGYDIHITNKNYIHPYLKSVNNNYARFYFSIRNQLLSLQKNITKNITFLGVLFMYIRSAITKALSTKDNILSKSCIHAIIDFFKKDYSLANNTYNIGLFLQSGTQEQTKRINKEEVNKHIKNIYSHPLLLFISGADREHIQFSKNIMHIFTNGILISSSSTIFTPLSILAPNIVCINEFDLANNKISISKTKNKNNIKNILYSTISLIASLGVIIILFPVIILYIGFIQIRKKIC